MSLKKVFLLISLIVFFIAGNSLVAYDVTYRAYFSTSQWSEWAFDGQTADRGPYTIFCGYFFTCSDVNQGQGHANIR